MTDDDTLGRRAWLRTTTGLILGGAGLWAMTSAWAAPPVDRERRRLDNRLELWASFARKSDNLLARYSSTRSSPLLREDLVESGALAFIAPGTLVLRDDGVTGSTTRIEAGRVSIEPNDPSLPRRETSSPQDAPALRWLAEHLVAAFAPGDGEALTTNARAEAVRGGTPRLSLMPPRDSVARGLIRSVTLTLEQVGGAVVRIEIAESDGGSFSLGIADHRQNVEPAMLERVTG